MFNVFVLWFYDSLLISDGSSCLILMEDHSFWSFGPPLQEFELILPLGAYKTSKNCKMCWKLLTLAVGTCHTYLLTPSCDKVRSFNVSKCQKMSSCQKDVNVKKIKICCNFINNFEKLQIIDLDDSAFFKNCLFMAWRVDDRGAMSLVICRGPF